MQDDRKRDVERYDDELKREADDRKRGEGKDRITEDEKREQEDNPERNDPTFKDAAHRRKYGLPVSAPAPAPPPELYSSLAEAKVDNVPYLIGVGKASEVASPSEAAGKCCYDGPTDCDSGRDWCSKTEDQCTKCGGTFHSISSAAPAPAPAPGPVLLLAADAGEPSHTTLSPRMKDDRQRAVERYDDDLKREADDRKRGEGKDRIKEDENREQDDNPERNDPTFKDAAHRRKYGLPVSAPAPAPPPELYAPAPAPTSAWPLSLQAAPAAAVSLNEASHSTAPAPFVLLAACSCFALGAFVAAVWTWARRPTQEVRPEYYLLA
jgi:hypothetical protein